MKKLFSVIIFVLAITVFVFELVSGIAGAVDVNRQFAELAERGAGGHELLGVGLDILVMGIAVLSIAGFVIALLSWKFAQYRVIRIVSGVLCPLFLLPILGIIFFMAL